MPVPAVVVVPVYGCGMLGGGTADGVVRRQQPEDGSAATWPWIQENTLAGLDALIQRRLRIAKLTRITDNSLPLPERTLLDVLTSVPPPRGGWSGHKFFLLDADTADAGDPARCEVELAYEPKARKLKLKVTSATRRALGTATHVRVAYADDFDLELLRQLRVCVQQATRAPLVVDLWSPGVLPIAPAMKGLNTEQQRAFNAMASGGAWLVWGPPGTGKTKVIGKAIARALSQGHSVLITSHTHVAVDNVVESVAETVTEAGQVIRVGASGQLTKKVSEHPWLTVDKAAAAMTNRVARLQSIQDAMAENESHPDRLHLGVVVQLLEQENGLRLESALRAQEAADTARHLAETLALAGVESARRRADFERIDAAAARSAAAASMLPQLKDHAQSAARTAHHVAHQVYAAEQSLASLRFELSKAVVEWSEATSARQSWSAGLPWRRRALDSRIQLANERRNILAAEVHSAEGGVESFRRAAADAGVEAANAHERVVIAESAQRRARELARDVSAVKAAESAAQSESARVQARYAEAQRVVDVVPDWQNVIAEGQADGTLGALAERDDYNERVATLDTAMKELIRKKKLLDDEYAKTKSHLLETAPVVACTLSSLTTKTELANRRF
ncbi:MAG: AAA domain-containing protein, partial [Rhodococcus sp. (in: high G+C Gram-positive bacteria)]